MCELVCIIAQLPYFENKSRRQCIDEKSIHAMDMPCDFVYVDIEK
jgi:hypothetical protein